MGMGTMLVKRLIGMNLFRFKASKLLRIALAGGAVIAIFCIFCRPASSTDISGVYIRSRDGVVDTLILATNGTFQQTITYGNESPWTKNGLWTLNYQVVQFNTFYEAFDFEAAKGTFKLIPPESYAMETLWVERGKLVKDQVFPIWFKQPTRGRTPHANHGILDANEN